MIYIYPRDAASLQSSYLTDLYVMATYLHHQMCPMRRTWRRPSRWARSHGTGWSLLWDRYAPTLLWDSAAVGDGSYIVIYNRRASSCCACNMPVLRCRILVRCCGSQSLSLCMHAFLSELFVPPPPPSSSYSSLLSYSMLWYAMQASALSPRT